MGYADEFTTCNGFPEIIIDGKTGYLFESGNETESVEIIQQSNSLNGENYWTMCDDALKFAKEHFNRKAYYPKLMSFFEKLAN